MLFESKKKIYDKQNNVNFIVIQKNSILFYRTSICNESFSSKIHSSSTILEQRLGYNYFSFLDVQKPRPKVNKTPKI